MENDGKALKRKNTKSLYSYLTRPTLHQGIILSWIYDCIKPGNRPIDTAATAHFTLHISMYNCTNCDPMHVKICSALHYIFCYLWVENCIFNKFQEIDLC